MVELVQKLYESHSLSEGELVSLIDGMTPHLRDMLYKYAHKTRTQHYGNKVYIRGLIEFTNYCKNDCYYCGIRRSNKYAQRYRLSPEQILGCCEKGYALGMRTFVLQGGEDPYFTDDRVEAIVYEIKARFPECAVTLSIGERPYASYKRFYDAGADRYLLRHETADNAHYARLHPAEMSLERRKECLYNLKEIGYQVGAGFMVGSPYQTTANLAHDLLFLKELSPQMVGIGPFIPQKDTPFAGNAAGGARLTADLLAIIRLMLPTALLPATTALGTVDPRGREMGLKAGANVVMPNLSPLNVRAKYALYDNKICTGEEAAECMRCISSRIRSAGFEPDYSRGDHVEWKKHQLI